MLLTVSRFLSRVVATNRRRHASYILYYGTRLCHRHARIAPYVMSPVTTRVSPHVTSCYVFLHVSFHISYLSRQMVSFILFCHFACHAAVTLSLFHLVIEVFNLPSP